MLLSAALLLSGGAVLYQPIRLAWLNRADLADAASPFTFTLLQWQPSDLQGYFSVDSVDKYLIKREGKDAFSLLLAHYHEGQQPHRALLFPKAQHTVSSVLPNPGELRQSIWLEAAKSISSNSSKDALFLSWWDDGQRIHFLSGRNAWLVRPAAQTFNNTLWQPLQTKLLLASESESNQLSLMARWLTMDCDAALKEIKTKFGEAKPIYLLVSNDLLFHLAELADYGGAKLTFNVKTFPIHDNLHGDIAQIKRWIQDEDGSNYLVQKEGVRYHVWTHSDSGQEKNSLLVRLLPFVNSLKKLPDGIKLVYQSHWGGYLSIYKLGSN